MSKELTKEQLEYFDREIHTTCVWGRTEKRISDLIKKIEEGNKYE